MGQYANREIGLGGPQLPTPAELFREGHKYVGHGSPNDVVPGMVGDEFLDLDSGIEWQKIANDRMKTGWVGNRFENVVNVGSYDGADPTGATSSQAAVDAAYAAISATNGGEIFFPPGRWIFNLLILTPNVTIRGSSHCLLGFTGAPASTMKNRFEPADFAQPVIQIGNNTGYVRGVVIRDCTFYGADSGLTGVYFAGGAFECSMENCAVAAFTTNIKVLAGSAFPVSLIYFDRVHMIPNTTANNTRGYMIGQAANYPTSYTTEIVITNSHIGGPGSSGTNSYAMEIDSVEVKLVNCYFDVHGNATVTHGVKLTNTLGATALPFFDAVNVNVDAGGSTNVAFEGYNNDRNFAGLITENCQIAGAWKELDGTIIQQLPQPIRTHLRRNSATRGQHIILNAPGSSTSSLQFRDQVNNKNNDITSQGASLRVRCENGGAVTLGNISGSNWLQVNGTDGKTFLTGAGIFTDQFAYVDSTNQVVTVGFVGTGTVVLSTSPVLIGGSTTAVVIASPGGQSIAALNFTDVLNSKTVKIWGQNGFLRAIPLAGGAFAVMDPTGVTSWFQVNGTDGKTFCFGAGLVVSTSLFLASDGQFVSMPVTITAGGTTGAQTINKPVGRVNFAAAAQTLAVTNSLVTANSVILATVKTDDATAISVKVSAQGAGSFTLKLNAPATAETAVDFYVINGA